MRIFFIIIGSLFVISSIAQENDQEFIQDPVAETYLNELAKQFSSGKAFQVEFKYEFHNKAEDSRVSDYGSVIIKDDAYKLKTEDAEVYFDGKKMWSYNLPAGEVYLSEPDIENIDHLMIAPFKLTENYSDHFKYRRKDEVNINGINYLVIDLYPKERNTNYSIVRLILDKKTQKPFKFVIQQKNGIDLIINILDIIENINVPDSTFKWDESTHEDVLLIEM